MARLYPLPSRLAHVTVLMLKNALVNINRPGRQDKFAFMPEEEKTSVSLTQRPRRRVGVVASAACCCHTRQADVPGCSSAGRRWQMLPHQAQPFLYVGHCDTSSLGVKCRNLTETALVHQLGGGWTCCRESPQRSESRRGCANCWRSTAV